MKRCLSRMSLVVITAACFGSALSAQSADNAAPKILRASHIAGARPKIDGFLDDAVWASAAVASGFIQREPNPGKPSNYKTEARVAYDADAVYVALRMFDDQPGKIISRLTRRDDMGSASDRVGVYFDSYRDRRTAFEFLTTPRGAQADAQLSDDTREDFSWDAVWEVETRIDSAGWTAEFRIPLSQLRYSEAPHSGPLVWGLQFVREQGRSGEVSFWSPMLPNTGRIVSLFGELRGDHGLGSSRRLELLPYTLGKLTHEPGTTQNPFYSPNEAGASAGADIKYGISSNLTLTATINPDFGQVEADPSVVNLGAFESFFAEKRPFFTEGSEIFRWTMAPEGAAFYSRRIGRTPQRSPAVPTNGFADAPIAARILGAAKLSGKTAGGWGLGLLHAITGETTAKVADAAGTITREPIEPLTNYSVLRLTRDFRGGRSGIGLIGTSTIRNLTDSRLEFLRGKAFSSGINWFHRFGKNQYESTGWLVGSGLHGNADAINSVKRNSVHRFQRPDAYHIDFDTTATSMYGWGGESTTRKIAGSRVWAAAIGVRSPGLDVNDIGFQSYADVVYTRANFGYRQFQPGRLLRSWTFDSNWIPAWSFGGELVRNTLSAAVTATAKNLSSGSVFVQTWLPVTSPWDLRGGPGLKLPQYTDWTLSLATNPRQRVSYDFSNNGTWYTEGAGYYFALRPRVNFRPSEATTFSLAPRLVWNRSDAQFIRTSTAAGSTHYMMGELRQTTGALVARASLALSPTLAFDVYAQPFVSGGTYRRIKEVAAPGARSYAARYFTFGPDRISFDAAANRYSVDLQPDGVVDFTLSNPNFNVRQLRSNAVIRWEYRPGSTLFLVWTQARDDDRLDNGVSLNRDLDRLFGAPSKNILLLKVSYWLTP